MDNDFYKMYQNFQSHFDVGMSKDIQEFFSEGQEISKYSIFVDHEGKVNINIKLHVFSKMYSKKIFFAFVDFVGYDYLNLFICENKKNEIKYQYLTKGESGIGVKFDIAIS